MTEKKKGRRPLPLHLRKDNYIQIALTKKQNDELEKIAEKAEKKVPVYVRENLIIPLLKDISEKED